MASRRTIIEEWIVAQKRHHLNDMQVQMARDYGNHTLYLFREVVQVAVQVVRQFLFQRFELFRSIGQVAFKFCHFFQAFQHLLRLLVVLEVGALHQRLEVGVVGIGHNELFGGGTLLRKYRLRLSNQGK